MLQPTLHCPCQGRHLERRFEYSAAPAGETVFPLEGKYSRAYSNCTLCGHWFSENAMDMRGLYGGAYVDNTYGKRMREVFERIIGLPAERSDNAARVARIVAFARGRFGEGHIPRLLDIGAGLGVFPYRMKEAGWRCTALDPDARATTHAREVVGVEAVTGDFLILEPAALGRFDVVTFNKVLEHVEDPVLMLRRALPLLEAGGFVYIELPDGEAASRDGPGREEFFIEHHHVFSPASVALLASRAGFEPETIERLREPSGKCTLRAFLRVVAS